MGAHEPNPFREARAGLITLSMVIGATVLSIAIATIQWGQWNTYRVGFKITQDATNIVPGTPVILGGLQWGKVVRVEHAEFRATGSVEDALRAAQTHASRGTVVEFLLDPRITLHPGATISRSATFLGSNVALVINDTGSMRGGRSMPGPRSTPIDQGIVMAASDPVDSKTALLGIRAAKSLEQLPEQFEAIKANWARLYANQASKLLETLRRDALALRDAFVSDEPGWSGAVERTSQAMDRLRARFANGTPGVPSLDETVRATTTRASTDWDALKVDAEALKERFLKDAEPKAMDLWTRARSEWARTTELLDRLRKAGGDSADTFYDFMADSSLMGGQISRTLETPLLAALRAVFGVAVAMVDSDMITRMERYDAASRLVIATDELRRANDALEKLAADAKEPAPGLSQELRDEATRAVTAFRTAVERLVDLSQQP
jgi:hypothetical protein